MNIHDTQGFDGLDTQARVPELLAILRHHVYGAPLERDPVAALIQRFRRFTGCAYAVPVATGTAALQVALNAVGVVAGDEVIVPANTCAAVAMAAMHLGALPVLADVDDSMTLAPARLASRITRHTRAVVVVHQYGIVADVAAIRRELPAGVAVIEDCAQAIGAGVDGVGIGRCGDASTYSFCHGKIVSGGQGGMVTTQYEGIAQRAARYARLGADHPPVSLELGHNFQLVPLAALAALMQLEQLDDILAARDALAARYRERLTGYGFRPRETHVPRARSVHHRQVCLAPIDGAAYQRWTEQLAGWRTRMQPAHPQPLYRARFLRRLYARTAWAGLLDDAERAFPGARAQDDRAVFLYVGPEMTRERVDAVCDDLIAALPGSA